MEEVLPRLYVGGDQDFLRLARREGFSFLRCCKYGPGGHQQTLGYHTLAAPKGPNYLWVKRGNLMALNLIDLDDPTYISEEMINTGLKFIADRMTVGDRVLVACNRGHSRGPTTALMYMASIGELPLQWHGAFKIFKTLYPKYDPAQGIEQFAKHFLRDLRTQAESVS